MKIHRIANPDHGQFTHVFLCPACKTGHGIIVGSAIPGKNWSFNGDFDRPTISPSILVSGHLGADNYGTCHSFVTEGKIQYLPDCTHALAGQTVELPEF
jgi:hypothetical protein